MPPNAFTALDRVSLWSWTGDALLCLITARTFHAAAQIVVLVQGLMQTRRRCWRSYCITTAAARRSSLFETSHSDENGLGKPIRLVSARSTRTRAAALDSGMRASTSVWAFSYETTTFIVGPGGAHACQRQESLDGRRYLDAGAGEGRVWLHPAAERHLQDDHPPSP